MPNLVDTQITVADNAVGGDQIANGSITNSDINANAAIAHSKLNLTNGIVNSDISSTAGITYSKLNLNGGIVDSDISANAQIGLDKLANASSGQVILFTNSNIASAISLSGDISIDGSGNAQIVSNSIVNADINSNAAIAYSKLNLSGSIYYTDTAANQFVQAVFGNSNQIQVSTTTGNATISLTNSVTINENLTVNGNLNVLGNTVQIEVQNLHIEDNIITLNHGTNGAPTLNAGIEVDRGNANANASIRWNESDDKWQFSSDGTTFKDISSGAIVSNIAPTSPAEGALWFNSDDGGTYVYYSNVWVEVGSASADIVLTTINAKGDLTPATSSNTIQRLAVGTNGQVLTANSSTATGLEWGNIATGANFELISQGSMTNSALVQTNVNYTDNLGTIRFTQNVSSYKKITIIAKMFGMQNATGGSNLNHPWLLYFNNATKNSNAAYTNTYIQDGTYITSALSGTFAPGYPFLTGDPGATSSNSFSYGFLMGSWCSLYAGYSNDGGAVNFIIEIENNEAGKVKKVTCRTEWVTSTVYGITNLSSTNYGYQFVGETRGFWTAPEVIQYINIAPAHPSISSTHAIIASQANNSGIYGDYGGFNNYSFGNYGTKSFWILGSTS